MCNYARGFFPTEIKWNIISNYDRFLNQRPLPMKISMWVLLRTASALVVPIELYRS